jgi:hypothetical protein
MNKALPFASCISNYKTMEHMHHMITCYANTSCAVYKNLCQVGCTDNVVSKFFGNFKYLHIDIDTDDNNDKTYEMVMTTSDRVVDIRGDAVLYRLSSDDIYQLWLYCLANCADDDLLYHLNIQYNSITRRQQRSDIRTFPLWIKTLGGHFPAALEWYR